MKTNELPKMNPPTQPNPPFALPLSCDYPYPSYRLTDGKGKPIAEMLSMTSDERDTHAAYLVRAANALPGLVAALDWALEHIEPCPEGGFHEETSCTFCDEKEAARAALKAAEAQP